MTIKEKIMNYIKSNQEIYEDKEGSFINVIIPVIESSNEDSILENLIAMLASQCKAYDIVLDNISQLGSSELIKKCREDLMNLYSIYEE